MAVEDSGDDGGAARESKFVNILQPNRDMATNWCVDVGKQLENYLDELRSAGLFEDGDCPLNFAEAALLIQGSIQVYSRKVEYLYNLVLRALDFLAEKKQSQEGDNSSPQGGDGDFGHAEEKEENFLNLDDEVPREADIDVLEGLGSTTPPVKVPTSLLITGADSADVSGDAGELASYYVAICTLYRDFLLVDPKDTETVDKYLETREHHLRDDRRREGGGAVPSNSPSQQQQQDSFGVPPADHLKSPLGTGFGNGGGDVPATAGADAEENDFTSPGGGMDMGEAGWQSDGDEGMTWDGPPAPAGMDRGEIPDATTGQKVPEDEPPPGPVDPGGAPEDDYLDPWTPLNPHEQGTLLVKPFKKGTTQRIIKAKKDRENPVLLTARHRNGLYFQEFAKALQAKERKARARRNAEDHSSAKPTQNPSANSDTWMPPDGLDSLHEGAPPFGDSDNEDNTWGGDDNAEVDNGYAEQPTTAFDLPAQQQRQQEPMTDEQNFSGTQEEFLNVERDGIEAENMSLEELCRAHVDSVLQKLAESQVRSGLTARVTTWKDKIEGALKEDESRPPFDIHEVGDRLLATLSTSAPSTTIEDGSEQFEAPFTLLVSGQPKDEIARSFAALLQLVNNGNVMIDKGPVCSESYCFTAENPFRLRLLNAQNRHEGMFENMIPSAADVTRGASSSKSRSKGKGSRPQQQIDHHPRSRPAQRIRTPEVVPERLLSPVVSPYSTRTPGGSGFRVRSFPAVFVSPTGSSVRRSSRKRGQSVVGRVGTTIPVDNENRGIGGTSDDKGYTPVKLTPNRRQTKRKPLQTIQL